MTASDRPAERRREISRVSTDRVRATRSWDAPSPVACWIARDVVRHQSRLWQVWQIRWPPFSQAECQFGTLLRSEDPCSGSVW